MFFSLFMFFSDHLHPFIFSMCLQWETCNKRNMLTFRLSCQVLHSLVCSVEKQAAAASGCPLLIRCKNFQVLHFVIPGERECHDVHLSLQRLSQPGELCYEVTNGSVWLMFLYVCSPFSTIF